MRRVMSKPCGLKVRQFAAIIIDLNKYFYVFPGEKSGDKCFETE